MQSNHTGITEYSVNDANRIVVYTPVGMNDWYVLSVVTSDFILSQQRKITRITITLIIVMLFVFAIITIFLTRLIVQKAKVEKDVSRYAINSENSQTLIFEYDFEKKVIEFTGNTDFVFDENLKQLELSDFEKISSRIHEAERDLLEHLRAFLKAGGTNYSSELRFIGQNDEYSWYRLSGTVIFDKDEKTPIKFIGNLVNVNAQVIHEQELKTQAETDLLSGLLNKIYMEKSVTKFIGENKDTTFGAFFIIDLDNFKYYNDTFGHSAGDLFIACFAKLLKQTCRHIDFIARFGGDEFVIVMADTSVDEALRVNQRLKESLKAADFFIPDLKAHLGNQNLQIPENKYLGFSMGICTNFDDDDFENLNAVLEKADQALYYSKENCKGQPSVWKEISKKLTS